MCSGEHAFIPAPNVAQLRLHYLLDGQLLQNVVYVQGASEWTAENLSDLCVNAATQWETNIAPLVSDQLALVRLEVRQLNHESDIGVEFEPVTPIVGEVTGGSLPNNVTLTTKFASGFTGRSYRGRVYTPGIPRASVSTSAVNEVTNVLAGDFSSSWANFFSSLVSSTDNATTHVVVSYCGDGNWRSTALVTPITSYTTNTTLDSQRRRLPERGM